MNLVVTSRKLNEMIHKMNETVNSKKSDKFLFSISILNEDDEEKIPINLMI